MKITFFSIVFNRNQTKKKKQKTNVEVQILHFISDSVSIAIIITPKVLNIIQQSQQEVNTHILLSHEELMTVVSPGKMIQDDKACRRKGKTKQCSISDPQREIH